MTPVFCQLGYHAWPRLHGSWREPVVQPSSANCLRCDKLLESVWRTVYPQDGSRCKAAACHIHA